MDPGRAQKASRLTKKTRKANGLRAPFQGREAHGRALALTHVYSAAQEDCSLIPLMSQQESATCHLHEQTEPSDGPDSRVKFHRRDRTSEIRPWIHWWPPSDAQPQCLSVQNVEAHKLDILEQELKS